VKSGLSLAFEAHCPKNKAIVLTIIAEQSVEPFLSVAKAQRGEVTYRQATDESLGARPVYEYSWNHTTLHAMKADKDLTYLQALYPSSGFLEKAAEISALFSPNELLQHFEFIRYAGEPGAAGIHIVRFTSEERLAEINQTMRDRGISIADEHAWVLEDSGGYKSADTDLMKFKREVDPFGICNPGKMRTYVPVR
jgi:hypothetical protein